MAESGEEEGIYQVLRKGFATTLAADESRLRLVSGTPATKSLVMVQYWPNIDPDYVTPLVNTAKATTSVTTPRHHLTKTIAGTYAVSGVRGDIADDGSGIISRTLAQVTAVTQASDLDNLGKVVVYNKSALHLFALQTDDSAATEGMQYALAVTWTNLANTAAVRDVCGGIGSGSITDANLVARVERIPDVGTDVGWTYVDRRWDERADGTATLTALFRRVDWDNDWDSAIERSEHSGGQIGGVDLSDYAWAASWLYRADDIPTAGVLAEYLSAATENLAATEQGVVGVTVSEAGEGRFSVSQEVRRFYTGATDASAVVLSITPGMGGAKAPAIVRVWWRRTKTAKDTLVAYGAGPPATYGPARSAYTFEGVSYSHADCDITDHGDGAYTVRQVLVYTSDTNVYFHEHYNTYRTQTRASDDKVNVTTYENHRRAFSSEDAAQAYIASVANNEGTVIVAGSVHGQQRSRYLYVCTWVERLSLSGWVDKPADVEGTGDEVGG